MKRWHCWLIGGVLLICASPFVSLTIGGITLSETSTPFSHEIRVSPDAVLIESGTQSQSWDGDGCQVSYSIDLKHAQGPVERISNDKYDQMGPCRDVVSSAAIANVSGVLYLRINDSIWSRREGSSHWANWTPDDATNYWQFVRWNPQKRVAVYSRGTQNGVSYRIYRATDKNWRYWPIDKVASQLFSARQQRIATRRTKAAFRQLEWEVVWVQLPRDWTAQIDATSSEFQLSTLTRLQGTRILKRQRARFDRKLRFVAPQIGRRRARSVEVEPISAARTVKFRSLSDNWDSQIQTASVGQWMNPSHFGGTAPTPTALVRVVAIHQGKPQNSLHR